MTSDLGTDAADPAATPALLELRVLEGPNLYFPRAAIKLTLDVAPLSAVSAERARRLATSIGLGTARPGEPGTEFRQRFVARALATLVRSVAGDAGTKRLAVRVRTTRDPHVLVVAYPWKHRGRARALGEAVADVLDAVPEGSGRAELEEAVTAAAERVRHSEPGATPTTLTPRVPVVAVTGTNGKTTTSRMVAHIARTAGLHVGWSSTDGIYVDGRLVEAGDYSGPSGAGRVLEHDVVQLAVTETARGGILLKGIGLTRNDVSVVTNVTADHLGLHGIDTLDQLAEVKGVVPRITRRSGWAVLNGDDPRVLAMRHTVKSRTWVFSRDADSPAVRQVIDDGGRATTVLDGWVSVLSAGADPDPLVELVDVPMTLAGLSRYNVENTLAAASAALGVGLAREQVVEGLRTFLPDAEHNPGRMNTFSVGEVTVVIDLAHNEAGLEALVEIMRGVRRPGGRLLLGLGVVGDRTDELIETLGELAARDSDVLVIGHKEKYLRGRTREELEDLMLGGAAKVGVTDVSVYPTEVSALEALVARARPGDVVALMCHAEREEVYEWIAGAGGVADTAGTLRAKVLAARG
ncbi:Mur ligase family protein [Nocardioides alkalitolerans]|uniref:Mur ligase family protein n=1 Tax=Nocardioides alkalitolerans TaxID=281714 RepID=UPI0004226CFC|nr:Mur ligase family protein [Nocardioides alkalitolerans]